MIWQNDWLLFCVILRDVIPTLRHEDFRLFACMNPTTDVGKKDLPPGIQNRFVSIVLPESCFWLT